MRTDGRNVLPVSGLPLLETGFSWVPAYGRHRCELLAEGVALECGRRVYDFDNHQRQGPSVLFQYTFAGEGRFQTLPDGRPVELSAGRAFLCRLPSETRYWLSDGAQWEFIYVILGGEMALELADALIGAHGPVWELSPAAPPIELLRGLHASVAARHLPDEFEAAALLHRFLMELFRLRSAQANPATEPLARARRLLEEQFGDPDMAVDKLAEIAHYSKFHFSRLFKDAFGRSPHTYLQQLRMHRALTLLTTTELPVKRIASDVGYRDYAYFCKEFKRHTGRTPMEVRRFGTELGLDIMHTALPPMPPRGTPSGVFQDPCKNGL